MARFVRTAAWLQMPGRSAVAFYRCRACGKLAKQLGIGRKTAWFLGLRLGAMVSAGEKLPLSGIVEADETSMPGRPATCQRARERRRSGAISNHII
jgi:hypothetical protein